jgi:glycosyltransferase involved in cell wall biosynthesis
VSLGGRIGGELERLLASRHEGAMNSLTIVIPALNEEGAIGGTIARCLQARQQIKSAAGLSDVEVIVVSDGSTDRTAEIAQSFDEVRVIVFEKNRGYGAAIKEGWRQGQGDLLGFLDADGTCDPTYFAKMCQAASNEHADIVLGSRLGPDSKMPRLRRLGNRIYALLLGFLCGRLVTDTASGMRVVRRDALRHLLPLPDGLHFTPSMSARALLNDLRVVELPMKYEERIGQSKLSVLRDGVRFLRAIFSGVLCYRPEKIFLMGVVACMLIGLLLAASPAEFYIQNRRLEDWMIYRFVACFLVGSVGLLLLLASALTNQMAHLGSRRAAAVSFWSSLSAELLNRRAMVWTLIASLMGVAVLFLWPGIVQFVETGTVSLHWSRLLAGAFALLSVVHVVLFSVLFEVVAVWRDQRIGREQMATAPTAHGSVPLTQLH